MGFEFSRKGPLELFKLQTNIIGWVLDLCRLSIVKRLLNFPPTYYRWILIVLLATTTSTLACESQPVFNHDTDVDSDAIPECGEARLKSCRAVAINIETLESDIIEVNVTPDTCLKMAVTSRKEIKHGVYLLKMQESKRGLQCHSFMMFQNVPFIVVSCYRA